MPASSPMTPATPKPRQSLAMTASQTEHGRLAPLRDTDPMLSIPTVPPGA
jgi:hypothetical protein